MLIHQCYNTLTAPRYRGKLKSISISKLPGGHKVLKYKMEKKRSYRRAVMEFVYGIFILRSALKLAVMPDVTIP
jgi:hypothetical protein